MILLSFLFLAQFLTLVCPLVANFALAGFANMGSLGIQIGVISGLAPSRAKIIATIAPSALIFGFLSTCQTATIAYAPLSLFNSILAIPIV